MRREQRPMNGLRGNPVWESGYRGQEEVGKAAASTSIQVNVFSTGRQSPASRYSDRALHPSQQYC